MNPATFGLETGAPPRASEPAVRDRAVLDLLALATILAIGGALAMLASGELGFDRDRAIAGVLEQLPVTLPAAAVVLGVVAVELGAGLVLARLALGRPFEDLGEAALVAFVAAVLKDVALLGVLGQVGLFSQPVLAVVDLAILALGLRGRPFLTPAALAVKVRPSPFLALVVIVWAGAVVLQLAAPVVPFLDVLPNHVAPAEHLRTFGSFTPLTATQSPIYGPSRSFLGYTALLGAVTTLSGLPAGLAVSAFILPSLLLVAAGIVRLATAIGGRGIVPWVLLTFALTASFARLTDARATVVVLPLVTWGLALVADRMRGPAGMPVVVTRLVGSVRMGDGLLLGLGLGAAVLVHPVVGFLGVTTLVILVIACPERAAGFGIPAAATAAVVALPQAATMVGIALPAVAAIAALPTAVLVGIALERWVAIRRPVVLAARIALFLLILVALLAAAPVAADVGDWLGPLLGSMALSLAVVVLGIVVGTPALRSPVLLAGLLAGALMATVTQLVPDKGAGLLVDALRFELPKTLHYWVPVFIAIAAATSLQRFWTRDGLPLVVRVPLLAAFLLSAALPLRTTPIDALYLGEHRFSETLAIDVQHADRGYWRNFPDPRRVVDIPRQELLDAVRVEIAAGRLKADTPVLHVAASFQQWVATPLGVFAGVTETMVSPDANESIHTVGGRLRRMADLPALLTSGWYPYVLLEPGGDLPAGIREAVLAAGYTSIHANAQGELFSLAP